MGTSSSQRSPSTSEWERVKQLYRRPDADPGRVSARIVATMDDEARGQMAGPGVASCLALLLEAARDAAAGGAVETTSAEAKIPPLVALSEALREQAEREISQLGYSSRFSDIALNALGTATFEAASGGTASVFDVSGEEAATSLADYYTDHRLHELALCFVAHDLDHLFRHLVTRDTADFVGGEGLPTIAEASQLRDAVAARCRQAVGRVRAEAHEQALATALEGGAAEGRAGVAAVLADLISLSLDQVLTD